MKTDGARVYKIFCDTALIFSVFVLPNIVAAGMAYIYIVACVDPISAISAALHYSRGSWLAYIITLPFFGIVAGFVNLVLLAVLIKPVSKSAILMFLAAIIGFAPVWTPYVIEAALRQHIWNVECNGYDGTILLDAVNYAQSGLSKAQFPAAFGGLEWQLAESADGIWDFSPVDGQSKVTYNLRNETYIVHDTTVPEAGNLTLQKESLEFPGFGLHSDGKWFRSCFAPAVNLRDSTGNSIVKTGVTAYTDCSVMEVCAMNSMGTDAVVVAIGRILIALQEGAQCCTRSRWE